MKTRNQIARATAISAVIAVGLAVSAEAQENELVGTWACSMSADDPQTGLDMNFDFELTYDSDGSYQRIGTMNIVMAAMSVDADIEMKEDGRWTLDELSLTETRSDIEFALVNEEPSQTEQMILQGMQAAAGGITEQTIELTSLSATALEYYQNSGVICSKL